MADHPQVTLYTYFRSSCSARLRIALALKSIPYTSVPINLLKDEQGSPQNTSVNPSATVPTLIIQRTVPTNNNNNNNNNNNPHIITITQSRAALEYLDEATDLAPATAPKLLPPASNPEARALVRTLCDIIACDVQPVTNLRILKRVAPLGVDRAAWSKDLIEAGFRAYEALVVRSAGVFSVGDGITMADLCLVPAVWGAQRAGVDLGRFPTIKRVVERLEMEEAVRKGHWMTQEDTPEEFQV
ncbi:hypothetical protein ARAM_001363 [Aspergillus rambellii]|uniref:Maleylacetoacetate isomerase MaiA n=1 Tax=Aspergillus rambellii TaxID=308745 RepID=A0A0F8UNA6_9EURO|nr:hypothetical protein ARAM_001363 [Aspergillus rambellii]